VIILEKISQKAQDNGTQSRIGYSFVQNIVTKVPNAKFLALIYAAYRLIGAVTAEV